MWCEEYRRFLSNILQPNCWLHVTSSLHIRSCLSTVSKSLYICFLIRERQRDRQTEGGREGNVHVSNVFIVLLWKGNLSTWCVYCMHNKPKLNGEVQSADSHSNCVLGTKPPFPLSIACSFCNRLMDTTTCETERAEGLCTLSMEDVLLKPSVSWDTKKDWKKLLMSLNLISQQLKSH